MKKDIAKIPKGDYCYTRTELGIQRCPYWDIWPDMPEQEWGYCHFLEAGDWQVPIGLLWDMVKECGENHFTDQEEEEMDRQADLRTRAWKRRWIECHEWELI